MVAPNTHRLNSMNVCGLSSTDVHDFFLDGRSAHYVIEKYIPIWYPYLRPAHDTYVTFRDPKDHPYILRMWTKGMINFGLSKQIGYGRKFNAKEINTKGMDRTVIFAVIDELPYVKLSMCRVSNLLGYYDKAQIPTSHMDFILNRNDPNSFTKQK